MTVTISIRESIGKIGDVISNTKFLERIGGDLEEIIKCANNDCRKATIVILGGVIETILYAYIVERDELRNQIPAFEKRDINLSDLLQRARSFGIITEQTFKLSEPIRDFRNLVHPRVQERLESNLQREHVVVSLNVLNIIIEEIKSFEERRVDVTIDAKLLYFPKSIRWI